MSVDPTTTALIPPGATLVSAAWHVALWHGPSIESWPTQAEATAAALAERPWEGRVTVDLRWHMTWPQGTALLPDGSPSVSSGSTFTVSRVTYPDRGAAEAYLDRVAKYEESTR